MARKKNVTEPPKITEKDLVGLRYFDQLGELLQQLHDVGCERDRAGSGKKMKWTLHTHSEIDHSVPTKMEVTPTAGGEHDERAVMDRMIESDRTYVRDYHVHADQPVDRSQADAADSRNDLLAHLMASCLNPRLAPTGLVPVEPRFENYRE